LYLCYLSEYYRTPDIWGSKMLTDTNISTNAVRQLTADELDTVGGGQTHDAYHMPLSNKFFGVVAAQMAVGAALLGVGGGKN
jgi:hypothetical protein